MPKAKRLDAELGSLPSNTGNLAIALLSGVPRKEPALAPGKQAYRSGSYKLLPKLQHLPSAQGTAQSKQ